MGPNERWQANTGFRFNLSDGYAGNPFPPSFTRYPAWNMFLTGRLTPDYAAQLRRYVADKRVTAVVVDQSSRAHGRSCSDRSACGQCRPAAYSCTASAGLVTRAC